MQDNVVNLELIIFIIECARDKHSNAIQEKFLEMIMNSDAKTDNKRTAIPLLKLFYSFVLFSIVF